MKKSFGSLLALPIKGRSFKTQRQFSKEFYRVEFQAVQNVCGFTPDAKKLFTSATNMDLTPSLPPLLCSRYCNLQPCELGGPWSLRFLLYYNLWKFFPLQALPGILPGDSDQAPSETGRMPHGWKWRKRRYTGSNAGDPSLSAHWLPDQYKKCRYQQLSPGGLFFPASVYQEVSITWIIKRIQSNSYFHL